MFPHAVTQVADNRTFSYDANGNMAVRGTLSGSSQNITWDVENRPVSLTSVSVNATFVYDGDGNRVKKIENDVTILYINKYYEVNLTGGNATSYYYLGDRLVAMNSTSLRYIHQDHLTGTAVVSSSNGTLIGSTRYYPYGGSRNSQGTLGTDKLFTGQRLDDTGLYYYNARYYDPTIGRFISADTFIPWSTGLDVVSKPLTVNAIPMKKHPRTTRQAPVNSQNLNRYSYVANNPLRYTDPTGWDTQGLGYGFGAGGLGVGISGNVSIVVDDDGNIALAISLSFLAVPFSASHGGQYQSTNANTVFDLAGLFAGFGASSRFSPLGGEFIAGKTSEGRWLGYVLDFGKQYLPVEFHGIVGWTWIVSLADLGFTATSNQLDFVSVLLSLSGLDPEMQSQLYQQAIEAAYQAVAEDLDPGQVVGWSSEEGYSAVDVGSLSSTDWDYF